VAATALGRRLVQWGLVAVAVLGLVQLAVLASDISGNSVLAALGELRPALDTLVGQALVVRVVLAGVAAVLLAEPVVRVRPEVQVGPGAPAGPGVHAGSGVHAARGAHAGSGVHAGPVAHAGPGVDAGPGVHAAQGRWTALALLGLVMLGTWAWTGHSRTERWPWLGVPVDIVHHGAAALWLGGLAVLAGMALGGTGPLRPGAAESLGGAGPLRPGAAESLGGAGPLRPGAAESLRPGATGSLGSGAAGSLGPIEVVGVMRRFSTTAMVAVIVIAVTGLVQTVRLHDDLGALLSGQHGRLVAVKAVAFVGMLAVAAGNRRRVAGLVDADVAGVGTAGAGAVGVGAAGAGAAGVGAAGLGAAGVDPAGLDVAGAGAVGVGGRSTLAMLRRSMLIDVGVGVAVIAVTTSLVVSLR
jgi:copper transport protein